MKKLVVLMIFVMSGAAFAEVGPDRNAKCKDIIDGINKKKAQAAQGTAAPAGSPDETTKSAK